MKKALFTPIFAMLCFGSAIGQQNQTRMTYC